MLKLPVSFESSALSLGSELKAWTISSGSVTALCSVPTQMGGPGGGFSPEDLFLQALINCFLGTFKVYAKNSRVEYREIKVTGALTVDQNAERQIRMQKCDLKIYVGGTTQPERIKVLVEKVMREGFILNSVKTEITHALCVDCAPSTVESYGV